MTPSELLATPSFDFLAKLEHKRLFILSKLWSLNLVREGTLYVKRLRECARQIFRKSGAKIQTSPFFFRIMEVTGGCLPVADRKLKPSKVSCIGSNRRRTIEVSATMLRDILIGKQAMRSANSNEDLPTHFPAVSKVSRGDDQSITPLFVRYPPQNLGDADPKRGRGEGCDPRPPPYYVSDTVNLSDSFSSGSGGHGACPCCSEDETHLYDESMYRILPNSHGIRYPDERGHRQLNGQFFTAESPASVPINAAGNQNYSADLITDQMESLQHKQLDFIIFHRSLKIKSDLLDLKYAI